MPHGNSPVEDHPLSGGAWESAKGWPGASPDAVDVWRCRPGDLDAAALARCERLLDAQEREHAAARRDAPARHDFLAARAVLRDVVSQYTTVPPQSLTFRRDPLGRPHLASPEATLDFNLSHTRGLVLIAVRTARPGRVGVDVEQMRERVNWRTIARRFFSPREADAIESLPADRQFHAFYACWCRKEALVKAQGTGIAHAFSNFAISVDPDAPPVLLHGNAPPWLDANWRLADLPAGPGFAASVAMSKPSGEIRLWDWLREGDAAPEPGGEPASSG